MLGLFQPGLNLQAESLTNLWFGATVSIFAVVSGLVLVYDPSRTRLARMALALQIPYFSSPVFGWRMTCGVGLTTVLSEKPIEGFTSVGSIVWINAEFGAKWVFSYFKYRIQYTIDTIFIYYGLEG